MRLACKGIAAASPRCNLRDLPFCVCNLLKIRSRVTYLPTRKSKYPLLEIVTWKLLLVKRIVMQVNVNVYLVQSFTRSTNSNLQAHILPLSPPLAMPTYLHISRNFIVRLVGLPQGEIIYLESSIDGRLSNQHVYLAIILFPRSHSWPCPPTYPSTITSLALHQASSDTSEIELELSSSLASS